MFAHQRLNIFLAFKFYMGNIYKNTIKIWLLHLKETILSNKCFFLRVVVGKDNAFNSGNGIVFYRVGDFKFQD